MTTSNPAAMIEHYQVLAELEREFPELTPELEDTECKRNMYRQLSCFARFTNRFIDQQDLAQVRRCFQHANHLWQHGDQRVQAALQNSYLYALHLYQNSQLSMQLRILLGPALTRCAQQLTYSQLP
ncbi:DUF7674 family protein [Rufibacter immobilis]|uniref:DUF7674 family protein n=1 Tax=Rufibacter immobilis TaxID=1348778 RepID=UPI0035E98D7C